MDKRWYIFGNPCQTATNPETDIYLKKMDELSRLQTERDFLSKRSVFVEQRIKQIENSDYGDDV